MLILRVVDNLLSGGSLSINMICVPMALYGFAVSGCLVKQRFILEVTVFFVPVVLLLFGIAQAGDAKSPRTGSVRVVSNPYMVTLESFDAVFFFLRRSSL